MAKKGETKECPACGKLFYRPPSKADQITCSRTCRARYMQDRGENVPCKHCGKLDRKSTRLNSSHIPLSRMPSSA